MASRKPATRPSMRHPSHNHPLHGYKAQAEDDLICSGCDLDLIGAAYKCTKSECDYFLHKSCVELPREIRHKSHPNHPLNLLYSSTYDNSEYFCDACGQSGTGFGYNCSICKYDIHVGCVSMPETMKHDKHTHPLTLLYSVPNKGPGHYFNCDVCEETMDNMWLFYCQKCDYGIHLHSCVADEEEEPKKGEGSGGNGARGGRSSANSELAAMLKAQREMEKMQIALHNQMIRDKIDKKSRKNILNSI